MTEVPPEEKNLVQQLEDRTNELRQAEAQLRQLQRIDVIGRLAGGVAHDFNNLLGAITMYCDLAIEDAENPADVRDNVSRIRHAAERGATLTRQLLLFGRKQISQPEIVDLNQLIKPLVTLLSRALGTHIEIISSLATGLRAVRVDPAQFEQAVMNLALNARDAMPLGGKLSLETAEIGLGEERGPDLSGLVAGSYVRLRVADTGMGMDAATRARIFDPFFTTKPSGKGAGLGLTTVYEIVRQCGGAIRVESELGDGTVFEIYLPVAPDAIPEPDAAPKAPVVSRTILLTEDDEGLRLAYFKMLQRNGFEVLTAQNGSEALAICKQHESPIALLLTDILMPGMSGPELAHNALQLRPEMRVLFMSGYAGEALDEIAHDLPQPIQLIQKPFGKSALIAKIKSILGE
jgi:nitrogen-specific signal transduction histidine kinase